MKVEKYFNILNFLVSADDSNKIMLMLFEYSLVEKFHLHRHSNLITHRT